jgi:hypothetical protein
MGLPETMKLYAEMVASDFLLLDFGFRCCLCLGVEEHCKELDVWLWCSKDTRESAWRVFRRCTEIALEENFSLKLWNSEYHHFENA